MLYGYRMSFEDSKPALWLAVSSYFIFQGALWAWKRWVEQGEVFRGRRRRIVKRVSIALGAREVSSWLTADRNRPRPDLLVDLPPPTTNDSDQRVSKLTPTITCIVQLADVVPLQPLPFLDYHLRPAPY